MVQEMRIIDWCDMCYNQSPQIKSEATWSETLVVGREERLLSLCAQHSPVVAPFMDAFMNFSTAIPGSRVTGQRAPLVRKKVGTPGRPPGVYDAYANPDGLSYSCPAGCDKQFTTASGIARHVTSVHPGFDLKLAEV